MTAPSLQAERLILRAPEPSDAPYLAPLADDLDVARMTLRMPYPYALADAEAFIARTGQSDAAHEVTWVAADGDGPVGVLGFFTDDAFAPEVGYWFGRPAWGRGYATEALRAALAWSDSHWRKPCLIAGCFTDNPASGRVLEKVGFLPTGVIETCWSLARRAAHPTRRFIRIA